MNPRYRFYLDNIEVNEPNDLKTYITTIKRDFEMNALFIVNDSRFEFSKSTPTGSKQDAYTVLLNKFLSDDFCASVEFRVIEDCSRAGDYTTIDKGYIKICNCEFDVGQNNVTVNVIDDAYFARIKNNKEIESNIFSGLTKNGISITSPTPLSLHVTTGCPSQSSANQGRTIRVYEAFKYLISFMTDDIMEFDSPVFGAGGRYENMCVNAGVELRDGVEKNKTTTSFSVLYQDMKKLLNLGFYIDNSGVKPKLIIDYDKNIYTESYSTIIHNVRNIKQSIYLDRLYSKVKFGGDSIANTGDVCGTAEKVLFNNELKFIGFKQEEYVVLGQCNTESMLDLSLNGIVDNNIIKDIAFNSNEGYDDRLIYLDCDFVHSPPIDDYFITKNFDIYNAGIPPFFINGNFTNFQVSLTNLNGIPVGIANYVPQTTDPRFLMHRGFEWNFIAITNNTQVDIDPVDFLDELDNSNGTYDIIGQKFIAPYDAMFNFNFRGTLYLKNGMNHTFTAFITVRKYDASDTLITSTVYQLPTAAGLTGSTDVPYYFDSNFSSIVASGEKIDVMLSYQATTPIPLITLDIRYGDMYFECYGSTGFGYKLQEYDQSQFKCVKLEFSELLSLTEFNQIQNNYIDKIKVDNGCDFFEGWIDTIVYNRITTEAKIILISKNKGHG